MGHLIEIVFLDAAIGVALLTAVMVIAGGLRWDDVRDLLLHDAYRTFTYEGERIPGSRPGAFARATILLLSSDDDRRLELVPELRRRREPLWSFDRMRIADCEVWCVATFRAR